MIFHFINAAQNLVAEHYILLKSRTKILFVEQCEWDFYMIFHFKEAQHLVAEAAEHYERFWHDFLLYGGTERGCRALWKRMGDQE